MLRRRSGKNPANRLFLYKHSVRIHTNIYIYISPRIPLHSHTIRPKAPFEMYLHFILYLVHYVCSCCTTPRAVTGADGAWDPRETPTLIRPARRVRKVLSSRAYRVEGVQHTPQPLALPSLWIPLSTAVPMSAPRARGSARTLVSVKPEPGNNRQRGFYPVHDFFLPPHSIPLFLLI